MSNGSEKDPAKELQAVLGRLSRTELDILEEFVEFLLKVQKSRGTKRARPVEQLGLMHNSILPMSSSDKRVAPIRNWRLELGKGTLIFIQLWVSPSPS